MRVFTNFFGHIYKQTFTCHNYTLKINVVGSSNIDAPFYANLIILGPTLTKHCVVVDIAVPL